MTETSAAAAQPLQVAEEPTDLIVLGRLSNPGPLMDKLGEWSGFPLPWQELVAERYPKVRDVLVVDAPTDFAVALEPTTKAMPEFLAVVSVPISDLDKGTEALKSSGQPNSSDEEGRLYVTLSGSTECTVARANGPTSARLMCGSHRSLTQLAPFAATNLPTQSVGGGDLFAELRLRPIHARYGKRAPLLKMAVPMLLREASLQNPRFDAALADSAHALTDDVLDLINEADKLRLTVDLDATTQQAVAELDFLFRGNKSFLPSAVSHAAKGSGSPPTSFWRLPKDAESVTFTAASAPFERLQGVTERLAELLAGALEHAGLASGVIDAWVAEFKSVVNAGGSSAFGHVGSTSVPPKSLAEALGCEVGAVEADQGAFVRLLDATVKVVNDAKVRAELSARLNEDLKRLPTVSIKATPGRWGLPAGSKSYAVTVPAATAQSIARVQLGPDAAKTQGPLTLLLIAVKQTDKTWVAWGADETLLVKTLQRALSGSDADSVAQNPELARWRDVKAVTGSSFRLRQFLAPSLFAGSGWLAPDERQQLQNAMPHGGQGFVHLELSASEEGPLSTLRVVVPRATVEDLAALAVSSATSKAAPAFEETSPDSGGTGP